MISFKKSYRRLAITREELHKYCKKLNIEPIVKPPRWMFLKEAEFKLVKEAVALVQSGELKKSKLSREAVHQAIEERKRLKEEQRRLEEEKLEQERLDEVRESLNRIMAKHGYRVEE